MGKSETHDHEPAHDVLAAEAFAVGAADPALHERDDEAHDVLAAEEFAVGTAAPGLTRRPFVPPPNPADPSGTEDPHDVLAAEEFALPTALPGSRVPISAAPSASRRVAFVAGVLLFLAARRYRRRR